MWPRTSGRKPFGNYRETVLNSKVSDGGITPGVLQQRLKLPPRVSLEGRGILGEGGLPPGSLPTHGGLPASPRGERMYRLFQMPGVGSHPACGQSFVNFTVTARGGSVVPQGLGNRER